MPIQTEQPAQRCELDDHIVSSLGTALIHEIQQPPGGTDPDTTRRQLAATLAAAANDRTQLEQLRACFLQRLRRASNDYEASAGLRVTEAALTLVLRSETLSAGVQAETQPPRGRWWHRWLGRHRPVDR